MALFAKNAPLAVTFPHDFCKLSRLAILLLAICRSACLIVMCTISQDRLLTLRSMLFSIDGTWFLLLQQDFFWKFRGLFFLGGCTGFSLDLLLDILSVLTPMI